jgi:hypothetical protein
MINKLAMIIFCEIILKNFFVKNHCEIQVRIVLECALYLIKYGNKLKAKARSLLKTARSEKCFTWVGSGFARKL